MGRILTTHTGSLVRPTAVTDFLAALERGESIDERAYEQALADAVADIVQGQIDAGIDVINDGEMGKSTWITYLYERVSGIEPRLVPLDGGGTLLPPSRDRQAFPEFYEEHDASYAREMKNRVRLADASGARRAVRRRRGAREDLGVHRPDHLRPDGAPAGHRTTQSRRWRA